MNPIHLSSYPVAYQHTSNVIVFLNSLFLVILILLATWEKYRRFNSYSLVAGDEGNAQPRSHEQTGLMDPQGAERLDKNWSEVLNRNVENFVPFFLNTVFIYMIAFIGLDPTNKNFMLTIYSFLAFQYVYLAARVAHAIGYFVPAVKLLRSTGFGLTALINVLLSFMAIVVTFTGDWLPAMQLNGDLLATTCKIVSIVLFVITAKVHIVLFVTYKVKYYDENLLFAARCVLVAIISQFCYYCYFHLDFSDLILNSFIYFLTFRLEKIARNDVEAFVPLCGFLFLFIVVVYSEIASASPLFPQYNFNPFLVGAFTLLIAFTLFRVAHSIVYYRGIQPFRSIFYVLGLLALNIFGLLCYAIYVDYYSSLQSVDYMTRLTLAIASLYMLDIWRTAVVACLTAHNRMMVEKRALNIGACLALTQFTSSFSSSFRDFSSCCLSSSLLFLPHCQRTVHTSRTLKMEPSLKSSMMGWMSVSAITP